MKRCARCGETKPLDQFNRDAKSRDGRNKRCRSCTRAYNREYYANSSDAQRAQIRERVVRNQTDETRAANAERMREWRKDNPDRNREIYQRANQKRAETDYGREWYQRNIEKERERAKQTMRRFRAAKPERAEAIRQRYLEKNADAIKARAQAKRKPKPPPPTERKCTRCKEVKPIGEFPPRKDAPIGTRAVCKPCLRDASREAMQRWRKANPTKVRDRWHRWYEQTKDASPDTLKYIDVLLDDPCSYCGNPMEHIDHIEPRSRNGSHDWANLTSACGSCNVSKGDRSLLLWLAR